MIDLFFLNMLKKQINISNKEAAFKEIIIKDAANNKYYNVEYYSESEKLIFKGKINSSSKIYALPGWKIKLTLALKTVIFSNNNRFGDSISIYWGEITNKNYITKDTTIIYGDESNNYSSTIEFYMPDTEYFPLNIEICRLVGDPIVKRKFTIKFEMEDPSPNKHGAFIFSYKNPNDEEYTTWITRDVDYNYTNSIYRTFTYSPSEIDSNPIFLNAEFIFSGDIEHLWYLNENNERVEIFKELNEEAFSFILANNTTFFVQLASYEE